MPGRSLTLRGFTVLQLLAVLLVLSLGAATTVRWYFSRAEVTLENAAILLARDLRAAQHRSIFLDQPGHFVFLPDGSGYTVTDPDGAVAHNLQTDEPFTRIYAEDGVFIGVRVLDALAGSDRTLAIDRRGVPLEDLTVTLEFGDSQRTIVMDRRSGKVTIIGSSSGWEDHDA